MTPSAAAAGAGAAATARVVWLEFRDLSSSIELDVAAGAQECAKLRSTALHTSFHPRHRQSELSCGRCLGTLAEVCEPNRVSIWLVQARQHGRQTRRHLAPNPVHLIAGFEVWRGGEAVAQLRIQRQLAASRAFAPVVGDDVTSDLVCPCIQQLVFAQPWHVRVNAQEDLLPDRRQRRNQESGARRTHAGVYSVLTTPPPPQRARREANRGWPPLLASAPSGGSLLLAATARFVLRLATRGLFGRATARGGDSGGLFGCDGLDSRLVAHGESPVRLGVYTYGDGASRQWMQHRFSTPWTHAALALERELGVREATCCNPQQVDLAATIRSRISRTTCLASAPTPRMVAEAKLR
jgi:hypothetical protein